MSAELIAIVVAAVTLGALTIVSSGSIRAAMLNLDGRVRDVETRLARLRGLLEERGVARPATDHGVATTGEAPAEAPVAVTPLAPEPAADANPAHTYLDGLAESGRRTMAISLAQAADLLTEGAGTIDTTPWHRLTAAHLTAVKRRMADNGAAPATVNRMLSALRGVARAAWRAGLITAEQRARVADVPVLKVRRLPPGRHVTTGETAALFAVCDLATAAGARDAAMLALLYGAGLRRAEAVGLDLANYDADSGAVTVTGKGGHQRRVYATNGGDAALDAWVAHRGDAPGALLTPVRKSGHIELRRMTDQAVLMRLRTIAARAAVAAFTPHDLRRTFIGDLSDAGADLVAVQRLAGHANVQTTARYDRRGERAARGAAGRLHVPVEPDPGRRAPPEQAQQQAALAGRRVCR